jgi:putative oxidoreductase
MKIEIKKWHVTMLRVTLGIVFVWFGLLKMLGMSPVAEMVYEVYSFLPQPATFTMIGLLEVVIGIGFLFNLFMRPVIFLFWFQMIGVFLSLAIKPLIFFKEGNLFLITVEGEFVIKNIVFIAVSIVLYYIYSSHLFKKESRIK